MPIPYLWLVLAVLAGYLWGVTARRRPPVLPPAVAVLLGRLDQLTTRLAAGVAVQGGVSTVAAARGLIRSFYRGSE